MALLKRNRFKTSNYKYRKQQRIVGIVALVLLSSFAAWASGALQKDPLADTPIRLTDHTIEFLDFRPSFDQSQEGLYQKTFASGVQVRYTVQARIQSAVKDFFKRYKVPYGAFVAMDPRSGEILAMVDYSAREPERSGLSLNASYPAASLFKMVTAAAAIEEKGISPEHAFKYRGKVNRLKTAHWIENPKRDRLTTNFSEAFAKSNNVVFAKIAYQWLDRSLLEQYAKRFGFNQEIPFELKLQSSSLKMEGQEGVLERTAAGFGDVTVSPLHAALIGAAIANDGIMMQPCLVSSLVDAEGIELYRCKPKALLQVIQAETAETLRGMMHETVQKGTVRKIFRHRARQRQLRNIKIGGKTGSLRGKNPKGRYSWFVGMAPLDKPEIVVAAMVVNDPVWHIVSAQVAKVGFSAYFGDGFTK